jgi:hypothetical protein
MTEATFPKSVVMAAGSEGFRRGWTEAVAACIDAVYAVYHENPCACLACETLARVHQALREVQT